MKPKFIGKRGVFRENANKILTVAEKKAGRRNSIADSMLITIQGGAIVPVSDEVYRAVEELKVEIGVLKERLEEYEGPEALGKRGINSKVVRRLTAVLYQCLGLVHLRRALLEEGADFDWALAGLWAIDAADVSDQAGSGALMDDLERQLALLADQVDIGFDQHKAFAFALRYHETRLAEANQISTDRYAMLND